MQDHRKLHLAASVGRLAASAAEQIENIDARAVGPDELALDFDDDFALAPALLREGSITARQYDCLCALSRKLDEISGADNWPLWTRTALEQSEHWHTVRALARQYLQTLNR
jgi:hypothetical protein